MGLHSVQFLIFLVAIAFGIFALTLCCTLLVHRVYRMLIPDLDGLKTYLQSYSTLSPASSSEGVLLRAKTAGTEAFAAKIDQYPVCSKTIWTAKNRIEIQFPAASMWLFRSWLQILLFSNAAFAAVVLHGATSSSHHQSELWWSHKYWSYPLTLGIIAVNLTLWIQLIREFNYVTSLDCQTNSEIIEEVEEEMEVEDLQRYSKILQFLFHKAEHAHARRSPEERDADMERVQLEFNRLPPSTKNLISAIFDSVATRRPQLAEKGEAGVATQRDMREALRLMGWEENETSAHIVETWFNERDLRQDGYLTFTGFIEVIMLSTGLGEFLREPEETRKTRRERLKQLFEQLDANKDNKVSLDELRKVLTGLVPPASERETRKLIHRIDPESTDVQFESLVAFVDFVEARTAHAVGGSSLH